MAVEEPKVNKKGYVVLKHPKTDAVQEFLPESVEVWEDAGWKRVSATEVNKLAEEPGSEITAIPSDKKGN